MVADIANLGNQEEADYAECLGCGRLIEVEGDETAICDDCWRS